MQKNILRIALQKTGRLAEGSVFMLEKCGIKVTRHKLLTQDKDFKVDFMFCRDDDIPGFVEIGVCDLGIIGQNLLEEYLASHQSKNLIKVIMPLGFARCRLSISGLKNMSYTLEGLNTKTIATSYPNILKTFLAKNNINAKVVIMHGSVELAPQLGVADFICDLVSSGATLNENGLQEFAQVMQSEAVLVGNIDRFNQDQNQLLDRLTLRINGILRAHQNKYIMLHIDRDKLSLLAKILPGSESPTILELQGIPNKVAVHAVSAENIFWDTIEKLKEIGASSILVVPIEKMVF